MKGKVAGRRAGKAGRRDFAALNVEACTARLVREAVLRKGWTLYGFVAKAGAAEQEEEVDDGEDGEDGGTRRRTEAGGGGLGGVLGGRGVGVHGTEEEERRGEDAQFNNK